MPRVLAGALAGLMAGVLFGLVMQMMSAPTPEGGSMPMMVMIAMIVGSQSLAVGWLYHLFNSAVIGAGFGWILGNRVRGTGPGLILGALYGIVWWVLGGLVLMPLFLGMPAFAPLATPMMRPVAFASLGGHFLYGLVLGTAFVWLTHAGRREVPAAAGRPARVG
jgi:hypothetical protein